MNLLDCTDKAIDIFLTFKQNAGKTSSIEGGYICAFEVPFIPCINEYKMPLEHRFVEQKQNDQKDLQLSDG